MTQPGQPGGIGTMGEGSLHAALKDWYARPGDRFEVSVDGFLVDIVRDDMLVEIQTRNFSAIKRKLFALTERHPVRLVYPVAREKYLVRIAEDGLTQLSRRKSPKHMRLAHLFYELIYVPELMLRDTFSLEVLVIQEEEVRRETGEEKARWRKGWVTFDRRLLSVEGGKVYESPADLAEFLPDSLPRPFTTAELADAAGESVQLAQKIVYCLRNMGVLELAGKRGQFLLYTG